MPTDTKLQNLIINDLTEEQYNALTPNENELYLTPISGLYQHSINISGTDQSGRGIDVYITIISSKNLNVNSLPNLKALLGNTFLYSATGFYDNSFVYAITQNGILFNLNGSGEVCSYDIIDPIFEDTVTTI